MVAELGTSTPASSIAKSVCGVDLPEEANVELAELDAAPPVATPQRTTGPTTATAAGTDAASSSEDDLVVLSRDAVEDDMRGEQMSGYRRVDLSDLHPICVQRMQDQERGPPRRPKRSCWSSWRIWRSEALRSTVNRQLLTLIFVRLVMRTWKAWSMTGLKRI